MIPTDPVEIEARAKAVGLTMTEVCRLAKVAHSTWCRFKGGFNGVTLATLERILEPIQKREAAGTQSSPEPAEQSHG